MSIVNQVNSAHPGTKQEKALADFDFKTTTKIKIVAGIVLMASAAVLFFVPGAGLPVGAVVGGFGFLMFVDGVRSAMSDIRKYNISTTKGEGQHGNTLHYRPLTIKKEDVDKQSTQFSDTDSSDVESDDSEAEYSMRLSLEDNPSVEILETDPNSLESEKMEPPKIRWWKIGIDNNRVAWPRKYIEAPRVYNRS